MNMIRSAKNQIAELTAAAYRAAVQEGLLPEGVQTIPAVEIPKDTANGDYTTTFCLAASKAMRKNPREVAKILTEHMDLSDTYFTSVEIAGPGFLNFRLGDKWYADVLTAVEEEKGDYGRDNWLGGKKYMVEFVSANPTGPMHMGNARGGVLGDTLAEVLDWSGADVWREFYVNDFGNQIEKFAKSIEARYIQLIKGEDAIEFPEDGYHGDDIRELAKAFYDIHGDSYLEKSVEERHADMARFGLDRNIPKMKSDLERYGIKFDEWFFESSLHNSGYVKNTVEELHKLGWTYEKEGALWLKTADIMREQYRKQGKKDEDIDKLDLKDDVLRRANGFLQALHDHGVAYDSSLVRASDWDRDSGYRLGGELIRAGAKAIFAQNDLVGTGVIDWCNQNGIEVGRDIFLIGYDNREISSVCRPSLSTVALPLFQMGQSAGHTLLDMLSGKHPAQKDIMLECTIIKRESTGG